MRILQLTPRLPYPPTDGGRVVMLQIGRALARLGCDVRVLSLNPRKHRGDPALMPLPTEAVDVDTSAHAAALLRSLRLGVPPLVARFYSPRFAETLREVLRDGFDVVQIESPFLLPYLPVIRETNALAVLRSLNVEFRLWEQERSIVRRLMALGLRRYEIGQLNACDAVVPITEEDAREFRSLGCTKPMHVLPGGVDLECGGKATAEPKLCFGFESGGLATALQNVGFLGSLDYRPNQEAARWILDELIPRLPDAEIHIAGSNAPPWLGDRRVPDAAAFIRSMQVMIVPIFAGGGMRIKIVDAMAEAKPVVSTTLGASGLDVRHGENILLADDAESFAAAVRGLLRDPQRATAIGEAGRRLVEERYSTDVLARRLLRFFDVTRRATSSHSRP